MSMVSPKQSTDELKQTRKRTSSLLSPLENWDLYIDERGAEDDELRLSVLRHGILQPLIVSVDNYVVSGNRRLGAARALEQSFVPVLVLPVKWAKLTPDERVTLLREHNRSRDKSVEEQLRETLVDGVEPREAHRRLKARRQKHEEKIFGAVGLREIGETRVRSAISPTRRDLVAAIQQVVKDLRRFLPITLRHIHYSLLDLRPLRNTNDPLSIYRNDDSSYGCLTKIANRMRLNRDIPPDSIHDPTRPNVIFNVYPDARAFLTECIEDLFSGFYRSLLQSQPHHVEIFAEKLTVQRILQPVAAEYTAPLTIGRGYCSLPAIKKIADRHAESGKDALIIVAASDHDPDGEAIVDALGKSLRDDFQIRDVRMVKAAISPEQIESYSLHPSCEAKASSANFKRFSALHGTDAYELEALKPNQLQDCVREAIDSVIDIPLYNAEVEREAKDAEEIEKMRVGVVDYLKKRLETGPKQ